MEIFLDLGTCANRFLVPENPRVPKISRFGVKITKLKKLIFFHGVPPIGGHKNFFGTRDLRQSISHARKPPSTKNQPIWRQKNLFREAYWACTTPLFKMVITRQFISNLSNSFFKSCSMDHKLQFYFSFFVSFL